MKSGQREITKLMKKSGFALLRQNKHFVWQHKEKKVKVVTPVSPSTHLALVHVKRQIRHSLAMVA